MSVRHGSLIRYGANVKVGRTGLPWAGNPNVAAIWIADSEYMTTTDGYVDSWVTQYASLNGAQTSFTLSNSGDARPVFDSTGMGSKGVVLFDGVEDYLETTESDFLHLIDGDDTDYMVIGLWEYRNGFSGAHYWMYSGAAGAAREPMARLIQAGAAFRHDLDDDAGTGPDLKSFQNVSAWIDTPTIQTLRRSGTSVRMYHDGDADAQNPQTQDVGTISGHDTFVVACRKDSAATSASNFTELDLRMLAVVLNDDEAARTAIENYFINEQGI